jgi:sterol desaturase/sphingolipid hydroxylase (fatty acid hydroxylase superfamily)
LREHALRSTLVSAVRDLYLYAIPFFAVSLLLEAIVTTRARARGATLIGYERRDTLASLGMFVFGNVLFGAMGKGLWLWVWIEAHAHRVFDLPSDAWWVWLLLFVGDDLAYYVFHRVSHRCRVFWAAHVNHHSSTHYNLSTALRGSWTTPFLGGVFWVPLAWLGFPPEQMLVMHAVSLVYQYAIHVEWVGKLGPLELVLNTPSHHRVHHGRGAEHVDRNYAGILIVWDRLFGTFTEERERPDYGLAENLAGPTRFDLVHIAFHEWRAVWDDMLGAGSWREMLRATLGPPPGPTRRVARPHRARVTPRPSKPPESLRKKGRNDAMFLSSEFRASLRSRSKNAGKTTSRQTGAFSSIVSAGWTPLE